MKACNECHIHVAPGRDTCPLCGALLESPAAESGVCQSHNRYPNLARAAAAYSLFTRIALFISLLGVVVCALLNLLVIPGFLWSLIAAASVVYFWVVFPPLLRRGVDFAKQTLITIIFTSALVIAIDFIAGYSSWSLSFVVPALCMGGTVLIWLMVLFNRTNWAQYVLYQVLVGLFGLAPLLLYLLGLSHSLVMVIVCVGVSAASLLAATVFGDRSIKSEFIRRFHF